ncbi:hypothetical protein JCM10213_004106 [Rhodosporidiobolus nylandii]
MAEADDAKGVQAAIVLIAVLSAQFGYFLLETTTYFQRFPKDRMGFKLLVSWLLLLELMFYAVRLSAVYISVDRRLRREEAALTPSALNLMSITLTSLVEATSEGWFCWRLWKVTQKKWMRAISALLWSFSTAAHFVWIGIAGKEGRASVVGRPKQFLIVQLAFWGTFVEGSFVAGCLLYELQFSGDRKVIKHSSSATTVSMLVSLAMRTSSILVVFELLVAIAVSIRSQPHFALVTEIDYAASIYTLLSATIVLYSLNYRSAIRSSSQATASAPTLRPPLPVRSSSIADVPLAPSRRGGTVERSLEARSPTRRKASGSGRGLGANLQKLSSRFGTSSGASTGAAAAKVKRGSALAGAISVSHTVSHVEEQVQLDEGGVASTDSSRGEGMLGPQVWSVKEREQLRE